MLLTITYTGAQTQTLGYLLHKNPYRAQKFDLTHGRAYVFYPQISNEETTAALLVELNPIDLAKGKSGSGGGMFDYVNDRPYVPSSFMSSAIAKVFGTAMAGKCSRMQELADRELDLTANLYELPVRGNKDVLNKVFEPLGYEVKYVCKTLDESFPEWGESDYVDLTLRKKVKLSDLLNHLYVLIPVFDRKKHYYVGLEEIQKLLYHGETWLKDHPYRDVIVRRYFAVSKGLANRAIRQLIEDEESEENTEATRDSEKKKSLNTLRLEAVKQEVLLSGASSVLDLGCGECHLIKYLLPEKQLTRITGADVSVDALEKGKTYLKYDRLPEYQKAKLTLMQGSLFYRDSRFTGYDCGCIVEVIEHMDPAKLPTFEKVIFGEAGLQTIIVTTPNKDYNVNYTGMNEDTMRHEDHRFEWTSHDFKNWAEKTAETYGYEVIIKGIGEPDGNNITSTQMGVFKKCG